jgi:hypothetical protein
MFSFSRKLFAGMPRPLAIRTDSLLVQCIVAAGIFFVPQDIAILGLGFLLGRSHSRNVNGPVNLGNPQAAVDNFLQSRGLKADQVTFSQGSRNWEVQINSVYQ